MGDMAAHSTDGSARQAAEAPVPATPPLGKQAHRSDAEAAVEEMAPLEDVVALSMPPAVGAQLMVQDMLGEFRAKVMSEVFASVGTNVGSKVPKMVSNLGERMAGLEDRTGRIVRAARRAEEANCKTDQTLAQIMVEILHMRVETASSSASSSFSVDGFAFAGGRSLSAGSSQESKDIHHHRVGTELLFFIRGDIWCKFALDRHAVALWILSNTDIYILPVERYRNICLLTYLQAPTVRLLVVLMRARCTSWRFIICSNVNLRTSDPSSPSAFLVRLLR